uniref:Brain enriched guanylate kinase associated n=1 Tax=Paramormyrops kingsleyae TaxID=1676925 RepID=A0A3B3R4T0_9TELE|nr:brain-enriched guanylate kinase-associated protein isoform X1 [Paramormyrops kingsleyae]XP_023684163.1 brain-enriched guanylate kinase-associated protein isoform X1 [Paramormyrops kingsleyae]
MQYRSTGVDRGVATNGNTLPHQPRTTSVPRQQESSSGASYPMFSKWQEDPPHRPPSRISSPSLQSSMISLQSSRASHRSSSPSLRSSSQSLHRGNSSEDSSWDTNSWSSGATCLLRSTIKKHSEEFHACLANSKPNCLKESGDGGESDCMPPKHQEGVEQMLERRDSSHSLSSSQDTSVTSAQLEQKIKAKLKFSQFLDEVTCRVLDPSSLEAFGVFRQRESSNFWGETPVSTELKWNNMAQWTNCLPVCKVLNNNKYMRKQEEPSFQEPASKLYLETDIDNVGWERQLEANSPWNKRKASPIKRGKEMGSFPVSNELPRENFERMEPLSPIFSWSSGFSKCTSKSTSLPKSKGNMASDGEMQNVSTLQEQKEDLRKRLSYTTHKLEVLETEFDSTRQYLETELRRAQEELEKFTDKLRRIQSSYAALQRINQDLEDKIHQSSKHHEEEKRALSREIIVLNNHLMEAKITIEKLREDNDLYRKDCNLAAQLLRCSNSHYRAHKLSELPSEFQERVSMHMEKHGCGVTLALRHSPYTDSVPTAVIAKVLEKPEPGTSCPGSQSPSPQHQGPDFLPNSMGSSERLQRRLAYKSSDLYCSDTALYCPEERRRERRQSVDLHGQETSLFQAQNSTDSNPEEEAFHSGFSRHEASFAEFATGSLQASSSYSSFSAASDEKGHALSSTLSLSQQALYMDWRDGDYEHKSTSSYEKESPGFPKSHSFQHMAHGPQDDSSPGYVRTASACFSEPYHSTRLPTSHSMGSSAQLYRDSHGRIHVPEEELSGRWRQLSVEDLNAYSYRNPGRISPYSFSEQHFVVGPSKIKLGPLYSSFQEGDDAYHSRILGRCFVASPSPSPSPEHIHGSRKPDKPPMYRAKDDSQESERSLFHSGSSKDKDSTAGSMKKEYVDVSPNSSAESLHRSPPEPSDLQHYQMDRQSPSLQRSASPQYQKFASTGLCRKDSLTKAQLYGTLLN